MNSKVIGAQKKSIDLKSAATIDEISLLLKDLIKKGHDVQVVIFKGEKHFDLFTEIPELCKKGTIKYEVKEQPNIELSEHDVFLAKIEQTLTNASTKSDARNN